MRLRKWMAILTVVILTMGLLPAGMAIGEENAGFLSKKEVLVKGQVVFNDPALQKAIENAPYYKWYPSAAKYLEKINYLDLTATESPITDLSVLQLCGKLETLLITSKQLKSLEPLTLCKKLKQLALVDCNAVDLSPLERCKGITALQLQGDGITDITALASLKKLKFFYGINLKGIDLAPLIAAPALTEVTMRNCVCDVTPLATARKLTALTVSGSNSAEVAAVVQAQAKSLTVIELSQAEATDALMQGIGACAKLEYLSLVDLQGAVSLQTLSGCKNLKTLYLDKLDQLTDVQALSGLKKLTNLILYRVKDAVFAGVDTLPSVTDILLYSVKADDLGFLTRQPKLQNLTLGALRGVDYGFISELASIKKLKSLSLYGVPLTTFDFANKLTGLTTLRLIDTGITDISALAGLKKLDYMQLYGNPITDYRPLRALNGTTLMLGDNLDAQIISDLSTANTKGYVQATAADADPLYDEAVFFGDENPKRRADREDPTAEANKAALATLNAEIGEKAEAELQKSLKNAKVAAQKDLHYYIDGDAVTVYGIQTNADIVRLPDTLEGKPVTHLSLSEWYTDRFAGIQALVIPASVTQIVDMNMHNIHAYSVDEKNTAYMSVDGAILTRDGKTLVSYPAHRPISTYTVPDGVERIAFGAFNGNTDYPIKLTVTLPASVSKFDTEDIEDDGAYGESRDTCVYQFEVSPDNASFATLDGSLTDREGKVLIALGECAGVMNADENGVVYTVPEGITAIGPNANIGWMSLTDSLLIPASLVSIQGKNTCSNWFFGSYQVAEGNTVFSSKEGSLVSLDGKTLYKAGATRDEQYESHTVIPEGVETVLPGALTRSSQVALPASVTSLSTSDLDYANISAFTVSPDNAVYSSQNGVLFSKDGKTLLNYPTGIETVDTYTVPEGVEIIAESSFTLNANIRKLVLPDTVRELRPNAVQSYALEEVTVPASVTILGEGCLPLQAHIVSPEGSATWDYVKQDEEKAKSMGYPFTYNITAK